MQILTRKESLDPKFSDAANFWQFLAQPDAQKPRHPLYSMLHNKAPDLCRHSLKYMYKWAPCL